MNCLPWVARKRMLGMLNDFSCLALLQFCQLPIRIQNGQIALVNVANRRATAIVSQGHESKPFGTHPARAMVIFNSCCKILIANSTPSWPLY